MTYWEIIEYTSAAMAFVFLVLFAAVLAGLAIGDAWRQRVHEDADKPDLYEMDLDT